jgi:hypothetical protein
MQFDRERSNDVDSFHIDSWLKFGIFMAASAWLAVVGVASFWVRRVITRAESEKDREREKHPYKAKAHAHGHSSHGPNGADRSEI